MPTPLASLGYMLGLGRFFPDNPEFRQYLLEYLPEHEANQVYAVSGCCLMARRDVVDAIGLLDESIFAFGEDIDWCVRAKKAGWEVWFYPESEIIHLKGQGGVHSKPYRKVWGMHQGMWIFYRKHLDDFYPRPMRWLVFAGISSSFALTSISVTIQRGAKKLASRVGNS
jgi:GT2 family glycosyltransferase